MKKLAILIPVLAVTLVACEKMDNRSMSSDSSATMQSNSESDRKITQDVRDMLRNDDTLGSNAANINVSTSDGTVTLRGMVDSSDEKQMIMRKTSSMQGVKRVDSQIEVKSGS